MAKIKVRKKVQARNINNEKKRKCKKVNVDLSLSARHSEKPESCPATNLCSLRKETVRAKRTASAF